ncbi:hypothetical protein K435DRAFT_852220 [Dendrothele bispora CBS 962.96]|uniref:Uncharacterized protein n=1 Tax=Dendrothele bispora (strain CBS 962.96) TaxID=1314807 RepID=A0A4V4HHL4_DENBC|nr:hypothetical protein K435DRAFT_852220 [Dendrothele bispora CBS 962.96]
MLNTDTDTQFELTPLFKQIFRYDLSVWRLPHQVGRVEGVPNVAQAASGIDSNTTRSTTDARRTRRSLPGDVSEVEALDALDDSSSSSSFSPPSRQTDPETPCHILTMDSLVSAHETLSSSGLKLHFKVFVMQDEGEAGSGYSCQTTCDGALNTGIPEAKSARSMQRWIKLTSNMQDVMSVDVYRDYQREVMKVNVDNPQKPKLFVKAVDPDTHPEDTNTHLDATDT